MVKDLEVLHSNRVERHVLSGILKYPDVYMNYGNIITEDCFSNVTHNSIFRVYASLVNVAGKEIDSVVLAQKVSDKFRKFKIAVDDDINIFDYIANLKGSQINEKGLEDAIKELINKKVRRGIYETAKKFRVTAINANIGTEELIRESETIFSENIVTYSLADAPTKIFENSIEEIEELGNNPPGTLGIQTNLPCFNARYGGLIEGMYVFLARRKQGKSLFLNSLALKTSKLNGGLKILFCDTEMSSKIVKFRNVSAITGIPFMDLIEGTWRKVDKYYKLWEKNKSKVKYYENVYHHLEVKGKHVDEVISQMRRWYHKEVGIGNKCIFAYDYLKLTGEDGDSSKREYEIMGQKTTKLQDFAASVDCPIIAACQLNQELKASQSDRISWFASGLWKLFKKTPEELIEDGQNYGTHKLIEECTRFQGREAGNFDSFVKVPTGTNSKGKTTYEIKDDYINLDIQGFDVEEKGTLQDVVDSKNDNVDLSHHHHDDNPAGHAQDDDSESPI
tara:strand:- start:10071 stop:11588 length:1518 start_codon:yes stop_codon:yes gene_type:complete